MTEESKYMKKLLKSDKRYAAELENLYRDSYKNVETMINDELYKMSSRTGISMTEAKRKVSKVDIDALKNKIKSLEKGSPEAIEALRIYSATMRINHLEYMKTKIGIEIATLSSEVEGKFEKIVSRELRKEYKRLSDSYGLTLSTRFQDLEALINSDFKGATFSERIWKDQFVLKNNLDSLFQNAIIGGWNGQEVAQRLRKVMDVGSYNARRLAITELARVRTDAQKLSYEKLDVKYFMYHAEPSACTICENLDSKVELVSNMVPGKNAPPMHPFCHCSTSPYESRDGMFHRKPTENKR